MNSPTIPDSFIRRFVPCDKLPVEFPSSMDSVRRQKEDRPYDSENPTFPFGYGMAYEESVN